MIMSKRIAASSATETNILDGRRDIGFGAEDVVKVEPLLTFKNEKGELEGVHYAQVTTVLGMP